MSQKKYWILTSLATFIVLPLCLSGGLLALVALEGDLRLLPLGLLPLLALAYVIYLFGKKAPLPDTFLSRYGPFLAPILLMIVVWIFITAVNGGDFSKDSWENYGVLVFAVYFVFILVAMFSGQHWLLPTFSIASSLLFMACFAIGTWHGKRLATRENKKGFQALALIIALAAAATVQGVTQYYSVLRPDDAYPELPDESDLAWMYAPFQNRPNLATPQTPPTLQIDGDYPRLDGAVALIPVYSAAANAIYQIKNESDRKPRADAVGMSVTTPAAYKALLSGKADIIFAAAPSEEQTKEAAAQGINYTLTPIGKEAFVFLVNDKNPVKDLSAQQIRDIYSGKINDWRDVGGAAGKIMAFQRNAGSGSQSAMERLMGQTPLRKPLEAEHHGSMGGIIRGIASYRNLDRAIGYSFRYYATTLYAVPGVRLLSVDGIAPTVENIRTGAYPFTADFYMVTARPPTGNVKKLHDWFLSDEGQRLIGQAGYVPLRGDAP